MSTVTAGKLSPGNMKALDFKDKMRRNLEKKMKSMPDGMTDLEKIRNIARTTKLGKKWLVDYSSRQKRRG